VQRASCAKSDSSLCVIVSGEVDILDRPILLRVVLEIFRPVYPSYKTADKSLLPTRRCRKARDCSAVRRNKL
jgi:hypothetical protein